MRCCLLLLPILLAGCAESSGGPSLARRPIESRDLSEPAPVTLPPIAADAELQGQIEGLVDRAQASDREFAATLPRTEAAAAAAGTEGSESWVAAQQLLTALEGTRAATIAALIQLDALLAAKVLARDEAGLAALQAAQRTVFTLVEGQQQRFERLQARISR